MIAQRACPTRNVSRVLQFAHPVPPPRPGLQAAGPTPRTGRRFLRFDSDYYRASNISSASPSTFRHSAFFPCAENFLASAIVAWNLVRASLCARSTEPTVGWWPSCAPTVCASLGPNGPLFPEERTRPSNRVISELQDTALADAALRTRKIPESNIARVSPLTGILLLQS
jgi:hypothetical protein